MNPLEHFPLLLLRRWKRAAKEDPIDELRHVKGLLAQGSISEEDYEEQKGEILNKVQ